MAIAVKEKEVDSVGKASQLKEPKFRNPDEMTVEELTDPDHGLKQLATLNGGRPIAICSKCHHCR